MTVQRKEKKMRLSGEVVLKSVDEFKDSKTGEARQMFKIYLKPSDPRDGATEVSLPEEIFSSVEQDQKISFDVALGVRTYGSTSRISVRFLGNLETDKAKKA
jgi:hypothetical protein